MWYNQHIVPKKQCKVHRRVEEIARGKWNTDISTSSMCKMSRLFIYIKKLDFEYYLLHSISKDRISFSVLSFANSKLPIYKHIYVYDSDVCTLCNLNVCGDEYHYILICPLF